MSDKNKTHERIIDAAEETPRGVALVHASLVLLLWALLAGIVVGAGCLATLRVVDLLQEVVWEGLARALPQPLSAVAPVLLCTLGGVLVGLVTSRAGFSLDTLGVVVGSCRSKGGYRVKSWPWALVLFALPIAFGGAVGPEAGVSGFTAALGTMAMHGMRRSGVAVARNTTHPLAAAWKALSPAAPSLHRSVLAYSSSSAIYRHYSAKRPGCKAQARKLLCLQIGRIYAMLCSDRR